MKKWFSLPGVVLGLAAGLLTGLLAGRLIGWFLALLVIVIGAVVFRVRRGKTALKHVSGATSIGARG